MIELDGAAGEGGGQILRSALTLAMVSGKPFRISRVRAGRSKPGLLRQHLTAIQAAAEICGAVVHGALPGSVSLTFVPGPIRGGDYRFAIGTAGSCTLVLQTVLPALWLADGPARLSVSGGTHNPFAPSADFLVSAWLPLMKRMGAESTLSLLKHGFHPAGGGEVSATAAPCALRPLVLDTRGADVGVRACALVAGVPRHVAERELAGIARGFTHLDSEVRELPQREGPGNALTLALEYAHVTEVFTGFGQRGRSAESVANGVARAARAYIECGAPVGEHLADQLVLPMALAGHGTFVTMKPSSHLVTNIAVIEQFLPVKFTVMPTTSASACWRVSVARFEA